MHHQYFDRSLKYNESFRQKNLLWHLPLEIACQILGATASWAVFLAPDRRMGDELAVVYIILVGRMSVVAWNAGQDSNHISYSRLPKDRWKFFVGPEYHASHHIDPSNFFGSSIRLMDWFLGTASSLRNRRVTLTGGSGALGQALAEQLESRGVKSILKLRFGHDWNFDDYSKFESALRKTDILILAHGSKENARDLDANCTSAIRIIEAFKSVRCRSEVGLLPEVWYVGSEAEFHGSWSRSMDSYVASKRAFVPFARKYYEEESFIYRHIVPAAFESRMDPGLVSARWTAKIMLWWIRRGARYVPATYTGFAFANYFRFMWYVQPLQARDSLVSGLVQSYS